MSRPTLKALALLLVLSVPADAQDGAESRWADLLARDELVSFTSRTELAALIAIEGDALDLDSRSAAIFALGASGSHRGRELLEETLVSGARTERCAAVLALGEIGVGVSALLMSLRGDPEPLVVECALLALMRTGRWAGAEYVEAVAESGDSAEARTARQILLFATDAPASEETAASGLLLELRWDAARHFGLVDGKAWEVMLLEDLSSNSEFLKEVLLQAAAEVQRDGVKDHFLSMAEAEMRGEGSEGLVSEATLRAALRAMPKEVSWLVETGLWPKQWDILLSEIRESRLEEWTGSLLAAALEDPLVRYEAVGLSVRSGKQALLGPLMEEIHSGRLGPMQLIWCCEALGNSGNQGATETLEILSEDERSDVAWTARVQLARLGSSQAAGMIRAALADPALPAHRQVVRRVCAFAEDQILMDLLAEALPSLKGMRGLEVSTALAGAGHTLGRERLREILHGGLPASKLGARAVEALSRSASIDDEAFLRHQFPFGEYSEQRFTDRDLAVNEALVLAMIRMRDPVVLPLLRVGIWESPAFDQSVLASALLIEVAGMGALLAEVLEERVQFDPTTGMYTKAPGRSARRVGYALGLWGGVHGLKDLSSDSRYVSDPALQGAVLGALASRTH